VAGKQIGYIRVSSDDQNPDRQLSGIKLDKVFLERASGHVMNRPVLETMMDYCRDDDVLYVHSIDRLARNLAHLIKIVNELVAKGVSVMFLQENLKFNGSNDPMSIFLLSIMGAFGEFERKIAKERQREGIEKAKKRGIYKGRKNCLAGDDINILQERAQIGISKGRIARELGISRSSVYTYLRRHKKAASSEPVTVL
jgi:DNA invertase Pin-like site-specific DNA recombinase